MDFNVYGYLKKKDMEDIRNLFPTEEMYNEFLSFQQMNDEERKDFANKNSIRFNSLSKEEQKKELSNLKSGIEKTVEFTDEQKNKLADAFEELSKEFNKASMILRSVS
jgi:uncharacterized protein with gpF-like domain